jgi:hypothetical protein
MAEEKETQLSEELSEKDILASYEGRVRNALVEAQRRDQDPSIEIAEPENQWNIWAIGPQQGGLAASPGQIIRVGEPAWVTTVVWLNAFYPRPSACSVISNLGCKILIRYCTGDLCSWDPAPAFNKRSEVPLIPDRCWYVDVFRFTPEANQVGLFEMNISATLVGCPPGARPPFAAFATAVRDLDADLFYPPAAPPGVPQPPPGVGPRWQYDVPIRFMVYP